MNVQECALAPGSPLSVAASGQSWLALLLHCPGCFLLPTSLTADHQHRRGGRACRHMWVKPQLCPSLAVRPLPSVSHTVSQTGANYPSLQAERTERDDEGRWPADGTGQKRRQDQCQSTGQQLHRSPLSPRNCMEMPQLLHRRSCFFL